MRHERRGDDRVRRLARIAAGSCGRSVEVGIEKRRPLFDRDLNLEGVFGAQLRGHSATCIAIDYHYTFGSQRARARRATELTQIVRAVAAAADDDDCAVVLLGSKRQHRGTQRSCRPPSTTTASPVTKSDSSR